MQMKNRARLRLESLEERAVPASFNFTNSGGATPTLTVTQTGGAIGALTVTDDPTTGAFSIADAGDGTVSFTAPGIANVNLNLLAGDTTAVTYTVASAGRNNLTIAVNNTVARTLNLTTTAPVGGNLSVTGGSGALTVAEVASPLSVGGNASFTGGNSTDVLNLAATAGTSIGGTLTATKFNTVSFDADTIGGNFTFNDSSEFTANALTMTGATVGGTINYIGGSNTDAITLAGATVIGQSLIVNLGSQSAAQTSTLAINATSVIGGSLSVTGSTLGTNTVTLAATATLAGNATFNMSGAATNTVTFSGIFAGSSFNYTGGAAVDTIVYNLAAGSGRARFTANLGAGNDAVTFGAGATNPSSAFIDFGAGTDTVSGSLNFAFTFLNLP